MLQLGLLSKLMRSPPFVSGIPDIYMSGLLAVWGALILLRLGLLSKLMRSSILSFGMPDIYKSGTLTGSGPQLCCGWDCSAN